MIRRSQRTATSNRRHHSGGRGQRLLEVKIRAVTARRQRRQKLGGFFWKTALVLALGVAAWLGISTALDKFFLSNPDYTLKRVTFELDGVMTRAEALEQTGIHEGENIFRADLTAAEKALRAIPQVSDVVIERRLPDHIAISLTARDPVAWVAPAEKDADPFDPEKSLLVDDTGFLMKPRIIQPDFYRLPVIYGVRSDNIRDGEPLHNEDLRRALALLRDVESRPECLLAIRTINISKGYCIEVVSDRKARITFLSEDFPEQLARLRQLLEHCRESGRELDSVNLMVRRNTPVTFAQLAASTSKASRNIAGKER
ncbi:MAG: FtsQ-type POTRA domain-containing protein [Verrucomicrobiae bacterium]